MGSMGPAQIPSTTAFVNTDVTGVRQEYLFKPPRCIDEWLLSQLKDERDAPMVYLLFNVCTISFPLALGLYLVPNVPHWAGFVVLVLNIVLFMERFILCLHYSEHVQIFKDTPTGSFLSLLCPWVLVNLFGIPPGVYRLHHLVMHHCENNLWSWDVSSTEGYQRDNALHFLCYWLRFLFAIAVELPLYAISRKRYGLAAQAFAVGILEYAIVRQLWALSPVATIWVVTVPLVFTSFALMFGNWSQHMFVDPLRSRNNYALTYNLVNTGVNMKTFNDGYHIIHHSNSKLHWSELPNAFMTSLDRHAKEDALIFEGLSFFDVGIYVLTGQLGALADRYVNIGQPKRSREELVAVLRSRLVPVPAPAAKQLKKEN